MRLFIEWQGQPWRWHCGSKSQVPLVAGLYSLVIILRWSYWSRYKLYPEERTAVENWKPKHFRNMSFFVCRIKCWSSLWHTELPWQLSCAEPLVFHEGYKITFIPSHLCADFLMERQRLLKCHEYFAAGFLYPAQHNYTIIYTETCTSNMRIQPYVLVLCITNSKCWE